MPVATQTFSAEYFGDLVTIETGEWATPGHELVRRYPTKFRADLPPGHSRGRRQPPSVDRSRASGLPEMRYTVEFTRWAWEEFDTALGEWDGCEVGGGLFGQVLSGGRIVVERVGRQALDVNRTSSRTEIPVSSNVALARALGSTWVGDWHTHDEGAGTPSPGDEQAWTGLRGSGAWLGVIVTPGTDERWPMCDPVLHAWTVGEQGLRAASLQQRSY